MLGFMDYVQNAFYATTAWDRDNSYGRLTATSRNLLDFEIPQGLRCHVSSLSSSNFASSYTINTVGIIDGSLSYLFTSRTLEGLASRSTSVDLRDLIPGYRRLGYLRSAPDQSWLQSWRSPSSRRAKTSDATTSVQALQKHNSPGTLLYGRLFLPHPTLEALYLRQLDPSLQVKISCVSDTRLPDGGSLLAHVQRDVGKHCTEYIYSTDGALFGFRGLYNFGTEQETQQPGTTSNSVLTSSSTSPDIRSEVSNMPSPSPHGIQSLLQYRPPGRLSAGGEVYYGLSNKSGGMSTGMRFTTLPTHTGFPYTMTLTVNPIMGNLSSTYSVQASPLVAMSSSFAFNVYSYESELQLATEIWHAKQPALHAPSQNTNWARAKLGLGPLLPETKSAHPVTGCLKARIDQSGTVGLLWQGRFKELLYSSGVTIDLKGGESIFKGVGVEIHYSS